MVERIHQEYQKVLGMMLVDVFKCHRTEWSELLPVVEFTIYNTPAAHGFTPRDLDRRWSLALPLSKELQPFSVGEFEPVDQVAKELFEKYREVKAKATGWFAGTSETRAQLANRFRKNATYAKGDRVVFRDPRAKAVGGGHRGRNRFRHHVSSKRSEVTAWFSSPLVGNALKHTLKMC